MEIIIFSCIWVGAGILVKNYIRKNIYTRKSLTLDIVITFSGLTLPIAYWSSRGCFSLDTFMDKSLIPPNILKNSGGD